MYQMFKTTPARLHFNTGVSETRSAGVYVNILGVWSWLIYTACKFINVRYGTGYDFPCWSPTLSGLMLVLSVPVLTRSPSGLQFLLAIATRLPSWLGPADLKRRGTLFGLEWPSEYHWNFQNLPWPSGVACVLTEHAHTNVEHAETLKHANTHTVGGKVIFKGTVLHRTALPVEGLPPTLFL